MAALLAALVSRLRSVRLNNSPADAPGLRHRLLETLDGPRQLILGTCHLDDAVRAGAPYTQTDLAVAVPA